MIGSTTFLLMFLEPPIRFLRRTVHCSFYNSKERWLGLTRSITPPPPFPTGINFIMKRMIDSDLRVGYSLIFCHVPTLLINPTHMLLEFRSMIITVKVVVSHKQVGMNHFVLRNHLLFKPTNKVFTVSAL